VESVEEEGGQPSSPLNSLLRSSEGRFLLTVLEEEVGEWFLPGDAGGKESSVPLDDEGGFVASGEALGAIVIDIVARRVRREEEGWMWGIETKKWVGGTPATIRLYISCRVVPLSRTDQSTSL